MSYRVFSSWKANIARNVYKHFSGTSECVTSFLISTIWVFLKNKRVIFYDLKELAPRINFTTYILSRWIPNPRVLCSKPKGGSQVDSAFHPSEVDKMSIRNFWELSGKK